MKNLFTLLCVALFGATAYAQDAYNPDEHTAIVRGTKNLCTENWADDGGPGEAMTYDSESGLWKITLAAKDTKAIEFKIVYDGSWYGKDAGNANYQFQVTEASDVDITFDPNTLLATYSGAKVIEFDPNRIEYVIVAGSSSFLNGKDWDVTAEENMMSEEDDGYYELKLTGVAAGNYNFKFAANGSWATQWGGLTDPTPLESGKAVDATRDNGGNYSISLPKGYTYDVTLVLDITNPSKPMVTATWETAGEADVTDDVYSIAGSMNSWNEKDEATVMTETAEGVYEYTFTALAAGDYQFKVVVNHDWPGAYGGAAAGQTDSDNAWFTLSEDGDVTIVLDTNTGTLSWILPGDQLEVTVKVTSSKDALNIYAWDGAGTALVGGWPGTAMTKNGTEFSYTFKAAKGATINVIFNYDGAQTADIAVGIVNADAVLEYVLNDDWTFSVGTGIQGIETVKADGRIYNLAGQRVSKPTRGLYIVNGKKVIK